MKNLLKPIVAAQAICLMVLFAACDKDGTPEPQINETSEANEIKLEPKLLANIELKDGTAISFTSEEDGIVYEESNNFDGIGRLAEASLLERYLLLTEDHILVPEDLLLLEQDQSLIETAKLRGTTIDPVYTSNSSIAYKDIQSKVEASAWCSGGSYYDTNTSSQFYRTFKNYTWGIAGTTVYSSWKSGGSKCKTVNLYLVNCVSNTLSANTWYKNVFGNYVKQNTINVGGGNSRFWSKTYTTKRYRRAFVSGFGSGKFGGYVAFKNY